MTEERRAEIERELNWMIGQRQEVKIRLKWYKKRLAEMDAEIASKKATLNEAKRDKK